MQKMTSMFVISAQFYTRILYMRLFFPRTPKHFAVEFIWIIFVSFMRILCELYIAFYGCNSFLEIKHAHSLF